LHKAIATHTQGPAGVKYKGQGLTASCSSTVIPPDFCTALGWLSQPGRVRSHIWHGSAAGA